MRRRLPPSAISLYSVEFDGVNDFVVAGTNSSFNYYHGATNPTGFALSISVWVKFDNPNANAAQGILATTIGTASNSVGIELILDSRASLSRTRLLQVIIARGVISKPVVDVPTSNNFYPNSTGWNHVLVTYDQALPSNNLNIYVNNGTPFTGDKTGLMPSTANASFAMKFGARGDISAFMDGKQFGHRFINKVLSAGERLENYTNPLLLPSQLSFASNITNAFGFPNGQADFQTMTGLIGGVNGTMTNQVVNNITTDIP